MKPWHKHWEKMPEAQSVDSRSCVTVCGAAVQACNGGTSSHRGSDQVPRQEIDAWPPRQLSGLAGSAISNLPHLKQHAANSG
jgi:hypothetical protein